MHWYKILFWVFNCLATYKQTNITTIVVFLLDYNNHTNTDPLKAALYSLQYFNSTSDLGINLYSDVAT